MADDASANETGTSTQKYYVEGDPLLITADRPRPDPEDPAAAEEADAGTSTAPVRNEPEPADDAVTNTPAESTDAARQPYEDGTSTARYLRYLVQPATQAQASPQPRGRAPAAVFELSLEGHQRAGYAPATAARLFGDASHFADAFAQEHSTDYEFDPPQEFESLPDLLEKSPLLNADKRWELIVVITHGTGAHRSSWTPPAIFFGDAKNGVAFDYPSADIRDFIELPAHRQLVKTFQQHVAKDATLIIIACGEGGNFIQLGADLRDLFGTAGRTIMTPVDIGFPDAGGLAVEKSNGKFRPFTAADWVTIPPKRMPQTPPPALNLPGLDETLPAGH